MSLKFPKQLRLLCRRHFLQMREARRFSGVFISVEIRPNRQLVTRLGITVTRRFGKAHLRNRFKRIVREAFRTSYPQLPQGVDLLIKPQEAAKKALSSQIAAELLLLLLQRTVN